jgi:hypothetical protein
MAGLNVAQQAPGASAIERDAAQHPGGCTCSASIGKTCVRLCPGAPLRRPGLPLPFRLPSRSRDATPGTGCSSCRSAAPPDAESPSPPLSSSRSSNPCHDARELGGRELFEGLYARRSRAAFKSARAFASSQAFRGPASPGLLSFLLFPEPTARDVVDAAADYTCDASIEEGGSAREQDWSV